MPFGSVLLFFFLFLLTLSGLCAEKVGLLVVATGKYEQFLDPLIHSARRYFLNNHDVTYFIFTDADTIPEGPDIVGVFQKRLGWPFDTLMRNEIYYKNKDLLVEQDYLFALDADMLFVDFIGNEILGDRVAVLHPGFVGKRGSYETNPKSSAYVPPQKRKHYFAGGFFGGSREEFFKITHQTTSQIYDDLKREIIAVWHDESHWNRYCIDHPPTVILSPSYCYPEKSKLKFPPKLICLNKNHKEIRK